MSKETDGGFIPLDTNVILQLDEWLQSIKMVIEFDIEENMFFAKADMKRKPHLHFYATDTGIKSVADKLTDDIIEAWKEYVAI